MTTRTVPCNTDAEAAVLGSVLIDQRVLTEVLPLVAPGDFYLAKHRAVYEAMLDLHNHRGAIDIITLTDALEKTGKLKLAGDTEGVSALISAVPSAIQAEHYARIVHETGIRRSMIDAATRIAKLGYDEGLPLEEALQSVESAAYALRGNRGDGHFLHIREAVGAVYDEFEVIQNGGAPEICPTGYRDLDRLIEGWRRQELTLVAARPGIGKTAMLLALAILSAKAGYGTLFFSAEMGYKMLVKRMLQAAGVGNLPGGGRRVNWDAISDNMGQLSDLPLWIDDTPNIGAMDIRARAMRLSSERRIDHIFVDYVQLIRGDGKYRERYLEIGGITKLLKQLARELDNHVIAASQLSRGAEEIVPTLNTLKESGAQEEDADNVVFIHRAREIPADREVVAAEIIVAKQRNGPTGKTTLGWMPSRVTFVPMQQGVNR
jgi:replicative DNA helicase